MTDRPDAPASDSARRVIGLPTAMALVMGNMIGSGVFLLPASLAGYGGLGFVGWLISAGGSILLALVFARLARLDPAAGGPYVYTRRAFGDLAGFLVAWGYWLAICAGNAALAVALAGYLDPFMPGVIRQPAAAALIAIAALWTLVAINVRGVRHAGRVQVLTTVLKVLPLAVVGVAGLFVLDTSHFAVRAPDAPAAARDVLSAVTLTLWAFLGLEAATIPAGHVRNPDRTIPRATLLGTALAALFYVVSTAGVIGVLSPDVLAATTAPFADAARALFGDAAAKVVAAGAVISCFGALNGWILVSGQLPAAVASDGLFPAPMASLTAAGTPARAIFAGSVVTTLLIASNYTRALVDLFTFAILLATLGTLVPYVFCSLAWFRYPRPGGAVGRGGAGGTVVATFAFVYALGAIAGAGADVVYWGFLMLVAGLPIYVWVTRASAASAREPV